MNLNHIYTGDALRVLRKFPSGSVNCVVTSPPYYCLRDYGTAGQIGLEKTPEAYIKKLKAIFMECRRVLKKDGTTWIVIGDSYAGSGRGWGGKNDLYSRKIQPKASFATKFSKPNKLRDYKNKDLIGIPWLLAFALRKAGWYLRQDIIWHKPNPMPESVRDRCTKAHEYIFLLTKSAKYYFDHEAMLEPALYDGRSKKTYNGTTKYLNATGILNQPIHFGGERYPNKIRTFGSKNQIGTNRNDVGKVWEEQPARNKRSVWTVPTRGFKGAHFATFPPALIRTCIEAGCPSDGVVLDPFIGAGTTALVAAELGRKYIGIELNADYVKLAEERLRESACASQKTDDLF
jgi:DNA modification methylase